MQVFISYAHTPSDTALAQHLADRLRGAGMTPWLDTEVLRGGTVLQAEIERAIEASDAAVFLVNTSWLNSRWTGFELGQFDRRAALGVKRVPILRVPVQRVTLPPALIHLKYVEWLDDESDPDARFWELLCAITGTEPGPASEWRAKGRQSGAAAPVPMAPSRPQPIGRPSLRCDRAPQWKTVDDLATTPSSELVVVPGTVGQDHDHFLQRIHTLLRMDPPRNIVMVDWPTRPVNRSEFFEALARAVGATPDAMAEELRQRLTYSNLVVLHPCVRARFVDDALVNYYSVWLPELIAQCRPRMNVKSVQPIEFPPDAGLLARPLVWLRLQRPAFEESRTDAEALIAKLHGSASPEFPVVRLRELSDVTAEDLREFCDVMRLNDRQRDWLLARVEARKPKTSKELFQAVDDYLPDARSI